MNAGNKLSLACLGIEFVDARYLLSGLRMGTGTGKHRVAPFGRPGLISLAGRFCIFCRLLLQCLLMLAKVLEVSTTLGRGGICRVELLALHLEALVDLVDLRLLVGGIELELAIFLELLGSVTLLFGAGPQRGKPGLTDRVADVGRRISQHSQPEPQGVVRRE